MDSIWLGAHRSKIQQCFNTCSTSDVAATSGNSHHTIDLRLKWRRQCVRKRMLGQENEGSNGRILRIHDGKDASAAANLTSCGLGESSQGRFREDPAGVTLHRRGTNVYSLTGTHNFSLTGVRYSLTGILHSLTDILYSLTDSAQFNGFFFQFSGICTG